MAIVRYTLVNGQKPAGMTDHGYFHHPSDDTWIGVGDASGTDSGSKTELSIDELKTYVKTLSNMLHVTQSDPKGDASTISAVRNYTDAEFDTIVDNWCSARGIS